MGKIIEKESIGKTNSCANFYFFLKTYDNGRGNFMIMS